MAEQYRFQLRVSVELQKVYAPHNQFAGEQLRFDETVTLPPTELMEALSILARFHDLAKEIRAEEAGDAG